MYQKIPATIQTARSNIFELIYISFDDDDIQKLCISLNMLLYNVIDQLRLVDKQSNYAIDIRFKEQKRSKKKSKQIVRPVGNWADRTFTVEMPRLDLENILGSYLLYLRDEIFPVDHIDVFYNLADMPPVDNEMTFIFNRTPPPPDWFQAIERKNMTKR
jgi:hypothetical protein